MKTKGIFFDLYGTLLIYSDMTAAWDDWLKAFHSYLVRSGLRMDLNDFSEKCDGFFEKDEPPVVDDHLTIYERRIQALCEEINVDLSKTELSIVAGRTASAFQKQIPVDPDAQSVLESLNQDYSLALVSNFDHPPHVISLLRENGLSDYFNKIIISGEVGVKKPDRGIFDIALTETGLHASDVVFIGDSDDDMTGARNAGMTAILIDRQMSNPGADQFDYRSSRNRGTDKSVRTQVDTDIRSIKRLPELVDLLERDETRGEKT